MVVEEELAKSGIEKGRVEIGFVKLDDQLNRLTLMHLKTNLNVHGFELLDSKELQQIELIKKIVITRIHFPNSSAITINWSTLIAMELNEDYNTLSFLFSSIEGMTLEQYIIRQKIERAKELISYQEHNISEISDCLGYKSVQHLSSQIKKITGKTPSQFKSAGQMENARISIDSISEIKTKRISKGSRCL